MTYEEIVRDTLKRLEELNMQMRMVYNSFPNQIDCSLSRNQ